MDKIQAVISLRSLLLKMTVTLVKPISLLSNGDPTEAHVWWQPSLNAKGLIEKRSKNWPRESKGKSTGAGKNA